MEPAAKRRKPNVDEEENKEAVEKVAWDEHEVEALVNKRRLEVLKLTKELQEAQKRLSDAEVILFQIQHKRQATIQDALVIDGDKSKVKMEGNSKSPRYEQDSYGKEWQSKPKLVVPTAIEKEESIRSTGVTKIRSTPGVIKLISSDRQFESSGIKSKSSRYISAPTIELVNISDNEDSEEEIPKRKSDDRECVDLISEVCSSKSASTMQFFHPNYVSSQHKRKIRSLVINPSIGHLCATSALDGAINFWKILENGLSLKLLSTIESVSPGQRRWPEDITWHPDGEKLFAAYSADGGDHQVSIINMHAAEKVTFLEEKPHIKGIVNSIVFMPWDSVCFATGGCDHTVVLWNEKEKDDGGWEPKALHRNLHTSAVMGVAGMRQKQMVLSVGQDKRIIGYDVQFEKTDFKHMLESKVMGLLLNPIDLNLFMVQTGTPGRQLRLFDIRAHNKEIHNFGWTQETSDSQSALIHQTWSPDGLYISTGSSDPKIHVFDIRYDSREPFQSIQAHQRRVFKAAWHSTLPLLISISSDLQIGLHKILK
ncbi:hypothetical protein SUGI_1003470 [Cryptomeria japonica]|uniref:uncharacterized protein LOC131048000 isoform X2 n=1 Tax=Cryptomeria japonica TaxID=3369 RepID=UPI002414B80D|nr:uncharacterized protein LOC131048000 isoform X2 [Cryptomeria japonica]GLJ47522.1 hypothetical protein SUGI_1003470 [Cryptomeria japonica]